jgi:hypothetical protein
MQCNASTSSYRRPLESRNRNLDNSKLTVQSQPSIDQQKSLSSPTTFPQHRKHGYRQDHRPDHRRQVASPTNHQHFVNASLTTTHSQQRHRPRMGLPTASQRNLPRPRRRALIHQRPSRNRNPPIQKPPGHLRTRPTRPNRRRQHRRRSRTRRSHPRPPRRPDQ